MTYWTKFYEGRLHPMVQSLTFLYTYHLWQEKLPFEYIASIDKWYSFLHTYKRTTHPFNCSNWLVNLIWIKLISKTGSYSCNFHRLSKYFNLKPNKTTDWKWHITGASPLGHYWEYSLPQEGKFCSVPLESVLRAWTPRLDDCFILYTASCSLKKILNCFLHKGLSQYFVF